MCANIVVPYTEIRFFSLAYSCRISLTMHKLKRHKKTAKVAHTGSRGVAVMLIRFYQIFVSNTELRLQHCQFRMEVLETGLSLSF